jgi:hypothetical protein
LINGNCCELGTGPIDDDVCEVLLLLAIDDDWDKFCTCAAAATAARNSMRHVAGVKSLRSHGCSSDGGEILPNFDLRSERKTIMRWKIY